MNDIRGEIARLKAQNLGWAEIGGNHDRMDAKVTGVNSEYFIHRGRAFPPTTRGKSMCHNNRKM